MARNEAFLRDVMEAAAELGNVPILIFGDFNVPPSISCVLQSAINSGRWSDAALSFACANGKSPANQWEMLSGDAHLAHIAHIQVMTTTSQVEHEWVCQFLQLWSLC